VTSFTAEEVPGVTDDSTLNMVERKGIMETRETLENSTKKQTHTMDPINRGQ
jgi:hypothetical protein